MPRRRGCLLPTLVVGGALTALIGLALLLSFLSARTSDGPLTVVPALPVLKGDLVVARYSTADPVALAWQRDLLGRRGYTTRYVDVASAAEAAGLLAAGEVDLAAMPPAQAALLFEQNAPVVLLAPCLGFGGTLLAPVASPIASVADLRGKRIAAPLTHVAWYREVAALRARGVDPLADSRPLPLQRAADAADVLARGDADAALVLAPVDAQLVAAGRHRVLEVAGSGAETCAWAATIRAASELGGLRRDLAEINDDLARELATDAGFSAAWAGLGGGDAASAPIARQLLGTPVSRYTREIEAGLLRHLESMRRAGYLRGDVWLDATPRAARFIVSSN